ncbi:hypothetical protein [Frankia sp. AiPa1]|uniref:hypothetical protein n=1 Tax=Frankia sp. AiPa1 TaxID=573492 RepID=UPI00202B4F62|nr:hypothetical protein [Frankia sp. AiPa1]MCL9758681.1 hypothetical protein [Frankia sp. AiPa1]
MAMAAAPESDRRSLWTSGQQSLTFLDEHLPATEPVLAVRAVAVRVMESLPLNSCLVLTSRRLLFVAPRPQVISWPLTDILRVTAFQDQIHIEGPQGTTMLGIDPTSGKEFEDVLAEARSAAVLVYG